MKKRIFAFILFIGMFLIFKINTSAQTKIESAGIVTADGYNLNVRQSASISSPILGKAKDGSYLTILNKQGDWYYTEYKENAYGYVHQDYVHIVSSDIYQVSTSGSNLNVRSGASTSYSIIEKIADADYVVVLSKQNGWAKVLFEGNKIGYVSLTYLSPITTYNKIVYDVVDFKQYDSRWKNIYIAESGKTIQQIGCLTTSMAMVESYRRGYIITPDYMESISSYTSDGSMYWPYRYHFYTDFDYLNKAYQILQEGKPLLIGSKTIYGGQHWVVIYGYKGGNTLSEDKFLIHDPASTNTDLENYFDLYPYFYKLAYYIY